MQGPYGASSSRMELVFLRGCCKQEVPAKEGEVLSPSGLQSSEQRSVFSFANGVCPCLLTVYPEGGLLLLAAASLVC